MASRALLSCVRYCREERIGQDGFRNTPVSDNRLPLVTFRHFIQHKEDHKRNSRLACEQVRHGRERKISPVLLLTLRKARKHIHIAERIFPYL